MKTGQTKTGRARPDDAALLHRVQQQNQPLIIGKLLHDLRNPLHSVRITVELFGRLTHKDADTAALLARAARYVGPAETAVASLSMQVERLAAWLSPPAPPAPQPIAVNAWLAELTLVLREAAHPVQLSVESTLDDETWLSADRPRLGHALLRRFLSQALMPAALQVRLDDAERICIDLAHAPPAPESPDAAFTTPELRMLIENAGGEVVETSEELTLRFARARPAS